MRGLIVHIAGIIVIIDSIAILAAEALHAHRLVVAQIFGWLAVEAIGHEGGGEVKGGIDKAATIVAQVENHLGDVGFVQPLEGIYEGKYVVEGGVVHIADTMAVYVIDGVEIDGRVGAGARGGGAHREGFSAERCPIGQEGEEGERMAIGGEGEPVAAVQDGGQGAVGIDEESAGDGIALRSFIDLTLHTALGHLLQVLVETAIVAAVSLVVGEAVATVYEVLVEIGHVFVEVELLSGRQLVCPIIMVDHLLVYPLIALDVVEVLGFGQFIVFCTPRHSAYCGQEEKEHWQQTRQD